MAIANSDGSIILTTRVDEGGLNKGLSSMSKTARSYGAAIAKSFLAIGVAGVAAVASVSKKAVSAFAEYEQMVGGVAVLWGKSAKKIVDYAEDAFFSAGVSVNEYMQQVTQFSAALIRSAAGDTDRAADIANMALIDMSDNVARLGTDIKYVQLAYQGFARQQYLLLDNLRLGYGGTREEMKRLLRDAEAITGVKYDIDNLADVYSAIHVIQVELGIAGATAEEAEKTLSGSAKMMKAAWQNALNAVAGGGDLDRAINNLVYSVQKYFENLVPIVERSMLGTGKLIEQVAPMLVQNVASALIQSIPSLINAIYGMILGLAKGIWEGIRALFTGATGNVTAQIKTTVDGVGESTNSATEGMENFGDATEEAGKKAKKSLAAFDDLAILKDQSAEGEMPSLPVGGVGGASASTFLDITGAGEGEQANWFTEILKQLTDAFSGLADIDLTNFVESLKKLVKPLQDLASILWQDILWGIETVLVPLTTFVVEDVLPDFIQKTADRLNGLNGILKRLRPLVDHFNKNFLQPILEYAIPKLKKFWDDFNGWLGEIERALADEQLWEDLKTVLGLLYKILVPVIKALLWLADVITRLVTEHMFNDLKTIISDVSDALGFLAAIINGDFTDAWTHLKELLVDNRIQDAKDDVNLLKDAVTNIVEPIKNMGKAFKDAIAEMVENWKTKISEWWETDVKPWFTIEKWKEVFFQIGAGIGEAISGIGGFVETWRAKISEWWMLEVAPWFTIEKWQELFSNISTSVVNFFTAEDGFMQVWRDRIVEWWENDVSPWFTLEKWQELGTQMKNGITSGLDGVLNSVNGIINKIIGGFERLANGAIDLINAIIDGYNSVAEKVGLPVAGTISHINLSKYKLPQLATGAVLPPNKPFLAVVGDQKHGTNIEAPLQTIVDAFNIALAQNGGANRGNTEVVLEIDGREFGRAVVEQGDRENRRIGTRLVIA